MCSWLLVIVGKLSQQLHPIPYYSHSDGETYSIITSYTTMFYTGDSGRDVVARVATDNRYVFC